MEKRLDLHVRINTFVENKYDYTERGNQAKTEIEKKLVESLSEFVCIYRVYGKF